MIVRFSVSINWHTTVDRNDSSVVFSSKMPNEANNSLLEQHINISYFYESGSMSPKETVGMSSPSVSPANGA